MVNRNFALITGASGGIGLEIARVLGDNGRHLIIVARRADRLAALAEDIASRNNVHVETVAIDLGDPLAADRLAQDIADRGLTVDTLINNAGIGLFGAHISNDIDREQRIIDVNITALTRLTKLYLPGMVERGSGRVMNVASLAAFLPGPYMAVYYATKAYVLSYSEALSEELRGTGVTVTALCPGMTTTGFQDTAGLYGSPLARGRHLPTARSVAQVAVSAMNRGRPVVVHRPANKALALSLRFLPRALVRRLKAVVSRSRAT